MAVDRAPLLDRRFLDAMDALAAQGDRPPLDLDAPIRPGSRLTARLAIDLFDAQAASRHLDYAARALRARNEGFYTIGSSGHEGNAAVAAALRPTDPGFLHYRSGAFFVARARQVPGQTPLLDVLLSLCASSDEPIAGGRHKVFGSRALAIPPQTSTIASHLPKAVGAAVSLDRAARLGVGGELPADAIIACTFGDASANHSTAAGAINTAAWTAFQHLPVPILFVCEDNGIGISVRTPSGWIAASHGNRPGIRYVWADGLDLAHAYDAACTAVEHVRTTRRPAFLHLRTVRLLGHAGSDVEQGYRSLAEIEADEAADPVIATARLLVESGARTADQVRWQYEDLRARIAALADEAARRPRLASAAEVTAPLAPRDPAAIADEAARPAAPEARAALWDGKLPEHDRPSHLAVHINRALGDLLARYPELIVFGEDVARKGGVYNVTAELSRRAGVGRVFNTVLDEQSILGLAIGAGHLGLLPVPEIQYLAYLHNAEDQLRGEAASLRFFSNGQYQNPMVVRIAGYAYQKGFGGHFHNDNSVAVLRDIPGIVIASPARGDDAAAMLRTCVAAARRCGSVCVFLEPIALYMTRDLHEPGDGLWTSTYDPDAAPVPIGAARSHGAGRDLLIVSFANGLWMSLRVARRLERDHGVACRVLDLRWLSPLPVDDLMREAEGGRPGADRRRDPAVRRGVRGRDRGADRSRVRRADRAGRRGRQLCPARCRGQPRAGVGGRDRARGARAGRAARRGRRERGRGSRSERRERRGGERRWRERWCGGERRLGGVHPLERGAMTRLRALIVCPGRGSYGRTHLGSLPPGDPIVAALDRFRARLGRPALSGLDRAPEYTARLHVAGEHASLLTFACTAVDLAAIDPTGGFAPRPAGGAVGVPTPHLAALDHSRLEIVGVTGNSLGFYTALYAAGALDLAAAAQLVETLGHYQTDHVIGGQLMYPLVGDDWRPSAANEAAVAAALDHPGVHVSIRLGGTIVLGADTDGLGHARRVLPAIERGGMRYPAQLPLHSAFHTPLMAATGERARAELADLAIRSPAITLIGGDGVVHRPWASPAALWSYTLGPQLVEPFDFTRAIATALGELGPDVIILPGPGDTLGGPIGQILVAQRWRGLGDRAGFLAMQAGEQPIVLAMHRPEQRARVVRG